MNRILFICHGNICRSTMAQSVMQYLVNEAGQMADFEIDSAATTTEELGRPPHHGTVRKLGEVGVPVVAHRARKVARGEYDDWDLLVYMDGENERHLKRIFGGDPKGKFVRLLAFAPGGGLVDEDGAVRPTAHDAAAVAQASAAAADVADPWYTGNFDETYRDVLAGCTGLLAWCNAAE
jgi:protein-tyrosine phosphatase